MVRDEDTGVVGCRAPGRDGGKPRGGVATFEVDGEGSACGAAGGNIAQRDGESGRRRDFGRAMLAFDLFQGEAGDLGGVGGAHVAVGCGEGNHFCCAVAGDAGDGELEAITGQVFGIDNSPVGGLGLQFHVEGQRVIGARDGKTVEPGIVVGHAPDRELEQALE